MLRERRRDYQRAGRAYLDYLAAHPKSAEAMLRFGMSAHKAGRPDVAKQYLRKTIATAPGSTEALQARKFLVMWE
jgi:TolA-binding protein